MNGKILGCIGTKIKREEDKREEKEKKIKLAIMNMHSGKSRKFG